MSTNIDQQAQEDFIKCWNGFKPYEKPVYQEFKDGFLCGHQAATSRKEEKIKALVEALHMYQKAGVGSSTDYPAQWTAYTTSLLAIEAAKETP